MFDLVINYWAVLVCALILMVLGALWYSTLLFGKPWMKHMGINMHDKAKMEEMKKSAGPAYAVSFVTALVMAYILAHFVQFASAIDAVSGALTGFWVWIGFVATTSLSSVLYAKKSFNLWMIDTGYYLVALVIMGAVLAVWK